MVLRVGHQSGLTIDLPSIDAVARARGAEMRQATTIFHAAQQQGRTVSEQRCSGIEHTIDRVGPIFARQDRICRMAKKQWLEACAQQAHLLFSGYSHERISFCSGSCSERISTSAMRNDSVDSAPWF